MASSCSVINAIHKEFEGGGGHMSFHPRSHEKRDQGHQKRDQKLKGYQVTGDDQDQGQ